MSRYPRKQAPGILLQTSMWIFHIRLASPQLSVYLWKCLSSGMKTWQRILASRLIRPKWASRQRDSRWKQIPLKSHVRLSFPTWKERHSGNCWHGLNHRTWDLRSDTIYWQRTDSSYLLLLPQLDWVCVEYAMNLIVHSLAFMEMHMNYCWPFVFPQFILLLLVCMHTCKYSYKHRIYSERKKKFQGHTQTQCWLVLNPPCSICCFWLKLYWTNSVYLAHTLFILCNNNTTVPGSSCSQRSGTASVEENKARPHILFMYVDVMLAVFIYFKKDGCHIHFMLHRELFPETLDCRRRCYSWRRLFISVACRTCHSLPQWANRNKTQGF